MFAVTIGGGQVMSELDVCQTPTPGGPVPMVYPNIAMPPMGTPPSEKVMMGGSPALNMGSEIPMTNGDQAGASMGVGSGTIMQAAKFSQGSQKVIISGNPAVRLTTPTTQNNNNAMGLVLAPSQTTVMIMS
jgi:hypothetical protein